MLKNSLQATGEDFASIACIRKFPVYWACRLVQVCKFLTLSNTLYFYFVISRSVSVFTVVPVSANGLGISRGFTMFSNK